MFCCIRDELSLVCDTLIFMSKMIVMKNMILIVNEYYLIL
jgi:hypothetical protein